jgi:hypothetical protein
MAELSSWQVESLEYVKNNMPGMNSFNHRDKLLDWCVRKSSPGLSVEFGVGIGTTLKRIAKKRFVYGFDCFTGLPEYWRPDYPAGTCAVDEVPFVRNSELVVGLFEETLPEWSKEHPGAVKFIHVDSDLYSSAKTIFDNITVEPGTIIVFDEYFNYPGWQDGEHKALMEAKFSWKYIGYSFDPPENDGQHVAVQVV